MRTGFIGWETRAAALVVSALCLSLQPASANPKGATSSERSRIVKNFGNLPLNFEENKGQTDSRVKFLSRGNGYALFLTPEEAVLSLSRTSKNKTVDGNVFRMQFAGANAAKVRAQEPRSGVSNYFMGSDPKQWITGSRHYGRVVYSGLYPGIDAVFYGNQKQLEYDFVVAPGADPSLVKMRFSGADRLYVDDAGALVLTSAAGDLRQNKPIIYQTVNGRRKLINGKYIVRGDEVTFQIARYDRRKPLVIDPVLVYSTYVGSGGADEAHAVAVDTALNAYIAGRTNSAQFPVTTGPFTGFRGGTTDAFVAKLNPTGNTLALANYLGGSGEDYATGVAVDADQNIFVVGSTNSGTAPGQFPINNAYQDQIGGQFDAFLVKYTSAGNFITYSTFIGGFQDDVARGITLDAEGSAYVVGTTFSTNFDASGGAQSAFKGQQPNSEGFIMKFSAAGVRRYGSYIGGNGNDTANAVAVDTAGSAYVTGGTTSLNFAFTAGVIQPSIASVNVHDAYVAKLNPAGSAYAYSTYLGGRGYDEGFGIAVDADGNAYVVGDTESDNFNTTGGFQTGYGGIRDAFIVKLNATASARHYASYIGGNSVDQARGVALDSNRFAHVVGYTISPNFPVNNFVFGTINRGSGSTSQDAFLVRVNAAGDARLSSTFLGGTFNEWGTGVAVDANGNAYLAGYTESADFQTISPLQATFAGVTDAFITKISNCEVTLSATSINVSTAAGTGSVLVSGPSDCPWTAVSNNSWITVTGAASGTGNGTVSFSFVGNSGPQRIGTIFIGGQTFTINQDGTPFAGCIFPPEPQNFIAVAEGQTGSFTLPTNPGCAWSATSNANWIQVFPPSGTGTTTVGFTVYPNFSTQVRTGSVTIGTQTFNVSQFGNTQTQNQRFVSLIYFNFLGRYPSQAEIDLQAGQLNSGVARADLVMGFYNTLEFNLGGRFIAGLYAGILARDPEFSGWLFQRNALARGGITQTQLVANFLNSQEFQLKYGTLNDTQFVIRMYINILGRTPSADEVNFQLGALPSIGRVGLALNFLNSNEFRTRIDARMTAFLLYATLLSRDATSIEIATRQNQIQTGTPIKTLVEQFIVSIEFTNQLI